MQLSDLFHNLYNWFNITLGLAVEYFVITGLVFMIFYVWRRKANWAAKIQKKYPDNKHIFREIRYSVYTCIIFGIVLVFLVWANKHHITQVYKNIDDYGWAYYFFSIVLMIFVHDAYFYWTHRMMHWKPLFKHAHKVHHMSTNPTAFAAYAFHPIEAVVQVGVIPLMVFTIPHHITVITVFGIYSLFLNVTGHMGYDLFPKWFVKSKWTRWHNAATHHNLHHTNSKFNYGLYFNFWDAIMRTNDPHYETVFEKVADERKAAKDERKAVTATTKEPAATEVLSA